MKKENDHFKRAFAMNKRNIYSWSSFVSIWWCFLKETLDEKWIYSCLQAEQLYSKFRAPNLN